MPHFYKTAYYRDSVTRKVFKLRLWGARLGPKDGSDPNFIVLRCPFNLLRLFKDGVHQSKTEFILGPSSDVKLTSDTIMFVNLPYTNIHALHSQISNPPGSDVNLTSDPDISSIIALF